MPEDLQFRPTEWTRIDYASGWGSGAPLFKDPYEVRFDGDSFFIRKPRDLNREGTLYRNGEFDKIWRFIAGEPNPIMIGLTPEEKQERKNKMLLEQTRRLGEGC